MTFIVFGALEIVTFMITFLFTRERVNTADDDKRLKIPVTLGFKALVKNKFWFMATLNLIFIARFVKKFGKRNVLMIGAAIMIAGYD